MFTVRRPRRPAAPLALLPALLAAALLGPASAAPLAGQSADNSLTIYNDGRVLVRRLLPLEIPKGQSQQHVAPGLLDPATLFSLDPEVSILAARYDAGVDQQTTLRRAVGRRLTFRAGRDTLSAVLLGVDPERYKLADGSVSFDRLGSIQFPAEFVAVDPTLQLSLQSAGPKRSLALGYFTQGGGWFASYQVLLQGATARVMGQAVVNGGPLRVSDAELQLLAGQVNVASEAPRRLMVGAPMMSKAREDGMAAEQKVGEFHLYTLPGRASLEPGVVSTVALFAPAPARITRAFEVQGQIPYWGGLPQYGDETEEPVTVTYTIARPRGSDLGDRPLPGGVVRLFEPDSAGRAQLIGEASVDHTPAGEDLRVPAGTAFDLASKRVQTSYTTRRDSTAGGIIRTVATADYRVRLTNAGDKAVEVQVVEQRGGEWNVVSSSVKPEKLSSTRTVFRVAVPARGKATLTYRVRVVW